MRHLSVLVLVLALVVVGAGLSDRVAAQGEQAATPVAAAVLPEECQVEPRAAEEVFALLGMTEGTEGEGALAERTPVPAPPWVAADAETVAAVTATTAEWLACINADDNLRIAALMTDSAIVRFFGGGTLDPDEAIEGVRSNLAGTPSPRPAEGHAHLVAVTDVSRLDDGRIAALALINEPVLPPQGQETLLMIFAPEGDRLLIDDIVQFSVVPVMGGTPVAGTPQP